MREDGRRARIMAAVADHDTAASAGRLVERFCRFADNRKLSEVAGDVVSRRVPSTALGPPPGREC